jgi:hypothetical protein
MAGINPLAVVAASLLVFVASSAWYIAFARERMRLLGVDAATAAAASRPEPWQVGAEIARSLVVALVVAELAVLTGVHAWPGALLLGLALWIGFPLIILLGSVQWERVPLKLAAIHAGDWVVKLVVIALVVSAWR